MMTKDKLRQLTGDERLGQERESEYLGAEDIDDGHPGPYKEAHRHSHSNAYS